MSALPAAAGGEALGVLRERARVLELVWLSTLLIALLALAVPWYLRLLDVDLAPAAWGLFAFGAVYLVASSLIDRFAGGPALRVASSALHLAGVAFLGLVWHLGGGVDNPLFLLIFALPVVASGLLLSRWQAYAAALLAIVVAAAVALVESSELRWYVLQVGLPVGWLIERLPSQPVGAAAPFAGLHAPPAYLLVEVFLFAVLMLAVALVSGTLGSVLLRVSARLRSSAVALAEAESLADEVFRSAPLPAVLLFADTRQVVQASDRFLRHLLVRREDAVGRDLFELVKFSYPEVIEELLATGGEVPFAVYRVGGETRVAEVRVTPIDHRDDRYRYLSLDDLTDLFYLRSALDAVGEPLLVVGGDARVHYFNRAAGELLVDLRYEVDADSVLRAEDLPGGWWQPGLHRRRERRVTLGGRAFRAACVAAPIRGEREALTVITLQERSEDEEPR